MGTNQPPIAILVITAIIALILQLAVSPAIAIFGVVPSFMLPAVILTAMKNGPFRSTIFGFLLGLIFDFCSLGPIGAMALVFTILAYVISTLGKDVFSGGVAVDIVIMVAAIAFGEFLVSVIYAVVGANQEFLFSLVGRVLPAIVYDAIIGILFLIVYNILVDNSVSGSSIGGGGGTGRSLTRKLKL